MSITKKARPRVALGRSGSALPSEHRKLSWLRGFLEMCEAGDDIVGATPKSLALRADLKWQISELTSPNIADHAQPGGSA